MFSAISSYLFGDDATEVQQNVETVCDTEDAVNDWIFVDHVTCKGNIAHNFFFTILSYYANTSISVGDATHVFKQGDELNNQATENRNYFSDNHCKEGQI